MFRLTRRGWNNVLIFASLFMIVLFSQSQRWLNTNQVNQHHIQSLLPQYSQILTIDFGQARIERIGRGWRSIPALQMDEAAQAKLIDAWQTATGKPTKLTVANPYIVTLTLAGEEQSRVFQVVAGPQGSGVLIAFQGQTYLASHLSLSDLIPQELQ